MHIEGSNGTVVVEQGSLRIRRKGLANILTQGIQGERVIPLTSIKAIQFKEAGRWMAGYIQFSVVGAIDRPGGILEATKDENAVLFERTQQPAFEQLRDLVQQHLTAPHSDIAGGVSALDELERLARLLDRGLLDRKEFELMKERLLNR
jgi:hypothetical protein